MSSKIKEEMKVHSHFIIKTESEWHLRGQDRMQTLLIDDLTSKSSIRVLSISAITIVLLLLALFNFKPLQLFIVLIGNLNPTGSYYHLVGGFFLMIIVPFIGMMTCTEYIIKERTEKNLRTIISKVSRSEYLTARYLGITIKIIALYVIGILTIMIYSGMYAQYIYLELSIDLLVSGITASLFFGAIALLSSLISTNSSLITAGFFTLNGIMMLVSPLKYISVFNYITETIQPAAIMYYLTGSILVICISYIIFTKRRL